MTADELIRLPRGQFRYELINGELKTMSPSGHTHGRVTMRLSAPLAQFVWDNKLGEVYGAETGFKLTSNPDTVLAPDIAFISVERFKKGSQVKGYWPGPPDLAVEVLSPAESERKVKIKIGQWFEFGTQEVWIVDPRKATVVVYRSPSDSTTFSKSESLKGGEILPGFSIELTRLFEV